MEAIQRRSFFSYLSGSFLTGTLAGAGVGTAGALVGIQAARPWSKLSHSQQGEDLIVDSMCRSLQIEKPTYLDIGAAEPITENNTYLFYRGGSRGVLVEPNPACCRKLRAQRPGDTVLNVGVGVSDQEEADYYVVSGPDGYCLNTFSLEEAHAIVSHPGHFRTIEQVVKMPLVNINTIIQDHFTGAPSFVSIDTEGLDYEILKSLDFARFRPAILCVETLVIGTRQVRTEVLELMRSHDYSIRGGTLVNTIFVDNRLLG